MDTFETARGRRVAADVEQLAASSGKGRRRIHPSSASTSGACFAVGPTLFATPAGPAGSLASWLRERGPSPYAATFRGGRPLGPLDPARTHGARLALE